MVEVLLEGSAMRRVSDHLDILELERRFRTCPDPVEARHVQVIWLGPVANFRR